MHIKVCNAIFIFSINHHMQLLN